ncbi:MAG: holo-ACP synthase, partial [Actinomycetia bacterium]|nr:holo-ACP synthase [Actinomycetes bacterium]
MPSKDESAVAVFDATSAEPPIAAASEASVAHPAGLGVDILEIERLQKAFQRLPVMRERLFSAAEIAYAESKARPIVHYALFFAAKEAVLKALGTGFRGMRATDVEVCHTASGRPYPVLRGAALAEAERQAVLAIELSLSYTHQVAVASAVAIRGEDQPRRPESSDPKAELLRQFKALRSLLDDLESELVPASSAVE